MAVRELARHRNPDRVEQFLGVLKAFAARDPKAEKGTRHARSWASTSLRSGAAPIPGTWRSI